MAGRYAQCYSPSLPEGRKIVLGNYNYPSRRDGKYNLRAGTVRTYGVLCTEYRPWFRVKSAFICKHGRIIRVYHTYEYHIYIVREQQAYTYAKTTQTARKQQYMLKTMTIINNLAIHTTTKR